MYTNILYRRILYRRYGYLLYSFLKGTIKCLQLWTKVFKMKSITVIDGILAEAIEVLKAGQTLDARERVELESQGIDVYELEQAFKD